MSRCQSLNFHKFRLVNIVLPICNIMLTCVVQISIDIGSGIYTFLNNLKTNAYGEGLVYIIYLYFTNTLFYLVTFCTFKIKH